MKQHINKSISLLLALLLCVGLFVLPAAAEELSGTCGDNLSWTLQNGVLTISGSGEMIDFPENTPAPWLEHTDQIQLVKVEEGVTSIGDAAFYHCVNLTAVTLPLSVKSLGDLAFAGCYNMTQIYIPGVEEIGWGCFYDCTALTSITLPECLRTISDKAFYHCSSLAGITIPASVVSLGSSAFCYCENLVYVKIKSNITVLPYWTFYGCDRLKELYLPSTIETVEESALSECPNLNYVSYNGLQEVEDEIYRQLSEETLKRPVDISDTKVTYESTDNATVITKTDGEGTTVNANVTDSSGWEEVADYIKDNNFRGGEPEIVIETDSSTAIPKGALESLTNEQVTVTIHTSDNVDWKVVLQDQTASTLAGAQDLTVTVSKNNSDKYSDTIGDAESFVITMGDTTLNSTVLLPLGKDTARKTATLYVVDGGNLRKLTSVIVDDDGKAAFSLAGTEGGKYIVALNVQDILQEEVIVPEKLAAEYGVDYNNGATLTDSQGNQYVLTGRVNKLGFGIGTLTLVVVGILVGSMILVGVVMVIWNKQQKQKQAWQQRRR